MYCGMNRLNLSMPIFYAVLPLLTKSPCAGSAGSGPVRGAVENRHEALGDLILLPSLL